MGEPHYTPTGIPRNDIFSSSQKFRKEFKRIETGLSAFTDIVPLTLRCPDINSATAHDHQRRLVIPFAGIITDVSAVIGLSNVTALTRMDTYINNIRIQQFQISVPADAAFGDTYFNPDNNTSLEAWRTVDVGDVIETTRNGSGGATTPLVMVFTWFLKRT